MQSRMNFFIREMETLELSCSGEMRGYIPPTRKGRHRVPPFGIAALAQSHELGDSSAQLQRGLAHQNWKLDPSCLAPQVRKF